MQVNMLNGRTGKIHIMRGLNYTMCGLGMDPHLVSTDKVTTKKPTCKHCLKSVKKSEE